MKLTPGSQRRGRSCKAVVQHFLQNVKEGTTKREKELIRSMSDAEAIAAMLSDVQINTSAAAKMSKKLQGSSKHSKGKKKRRVEKRRKGEIRRSQWRVAKCINKADKVTFVLFALLCWSRIDPLRDFNSSL